jgi:hypothetical protein
MPLFIAALWGAVVPMLGTLVGRVLVSLGIGYVTYTGIDASLMWAKAQFLSSLAGAPAAAVGLASTMKVGVCVSMLLSAVAARLVLAGLTSGALTKMVTK